MKPQLIITGAKFRLIILCSILLVFAYAFLLPGCSTFLSSRKAYSPETGNRIVAIAVQYRRTPFRWGGTTPDGFDCSGYTSYVYRKAGIKIPRTASMQYDSGHSVSRSDLRKGDLVFFMRWPVIGFFLSPSHVGIYVGNNRFIHSPSSGGSVRFDSLDNTYWKSRYKGARFYN